LIRWADSTFRGSSDSTSVEIRSLEACQIASPVTIVTTSITLFG
jgi:hypothetical protein